MKYFSKITTATALALLLLGNYCHAAVISILPADSTVEIGDMVTVDVMISDLTDNQALGVYDLMISFNQLIVMADSVSFGSELSFGFPSDQMSDFTTAGVANVWETSFDDPGTLITNQADEFTLFSLTFEAMSAGMTVLGFNMDDSVVGDQMGDPLDVIFNTARITVNGDPSEVPAPATLLLFSFALLPLLRNKRRS